MSTSSPSPAIWYNAGLSANALNRFRDGIGQRTVHLARDASEGLRDCDIAFGQPDPETIRDAPRLRWVHLTSAGYTRYDRDDLRAALRSRGAVLTNSSHVYDEPCAQHALAMILGLARQLPEALIDQRDGHKWDTAPRRARAFLLDDRQTVLMLGYGAIGRRLAELLRPFGCRVIAFRRHPQSGSQNGGDVEQIGENELESALAIADHVVDILPESSATTGFMNAARFARMKPGARFYNIGRGATVDQDALIASLTGGGRLAAAYLDVTTPEPLPPNHVLWTRPNCFITPHSAGGHVDEEERLVAHFLRNLAAFEAGRELEDRVV